MNGVQRKQKVSPFVRRWDGMPMPNNGVLGPNQASNPLQCVNVWNEWCAYLRLPPFVGNAVDFWNNRQNLEDFVYIDNTPANAPHRGDAVVFAATPDGYIGPFGHVCLTIWSTLDHFLGLDQDFPPGSVCHKQPHTYKGVVGFIRPKCLI